MFSGYVGEIPVKRQRVVFVSVGFGLERTVVRIFVYTPLINRVNLRLDDLLR